MSLAVAMPPTAPMRVQRYEPVGSARDLIAARDREVLAVGPAGTGKTLAACWKVHLAAMRYPNSRWLMTRKTLESLKSGALNTYINGVQPRLYGVATFGGNKFFPAEFRYPNGSVILVSGMDKAEKVLSAEFDGIYVNEVTEPGFTETDWETLLTRLRNGVMPYQQIIADGNPAGPRHWMNQRCNAGVTRRITSTHKDNPVYWNRKENDWTDVGREYVQTVLANLTGVQRKRLFEGVWAAAEGLVYQAFAPEMIRVMDVEHWRTALCVDVGSRNPTAILRLHQRGDGAHHHVSREVYRRNMTSTDILAAVREEADATHPEAIYMDPSAKGYIDDLQREGYPVVAADNDVLEGIQRVQSVLQQGFSIDPSCVHTIEEFGLYAYPSTGRTETDKPIKDHDHALDSLRYGIAGMTEPAHVLGVF